MHNQISNLHLVYSTIITLNSKLKPRLRFWAGGPLVTGDRKRPRTVCCLYLELALINKDTIKL
jgi:hypothetical protein